MNPERGRKLVLEIVRCRPPDKFQNMNPERGRKRQTRRQTQSCAEISEHEPRKGTETGTKPFFLAASPPISEHEPRKGTETRYRPCILVEYGGFQNMNPERGRKRLLRAARFIPITPFQFQNMNPERGRKLLQQALCPFYSNISEHEPRKGTETAFLLSASLKPLLLFQNMNPERGRKPSQGICGSYHYPLISEHEPRKGTVDSGGGT